MFDKVQLLVSNTWLVLKKSLECTIYIFCFAITAAQICRIAVAFNNNFNIILQAILFRRR